MTLLKVEDLHIYYGKVHALKGISLCVEEGEIVSLLGGNGAGKSTMLRAISGLIRPRQGEIYFNDILLNNAPTTLIVKEGISHSPEGRRVFSILTVEENLMMGAYSRTDKDEIAASLKWVYKLFPRLLERRKQFARTLSGGEQQMLAISRALMSKPRLLMLDEPSLGLAPFLVKGIFDTIRSINEQGVTILLVEQNARAALKLAHRAYVIETGKIALTGTAAELLSSEQVRKAYLGEV